MVIQLCKGCDNPVDETSKKIIVYYINYKPVTSRYCKDCIKKQYEKIKQELNPEWSNEDENT